MLFSRNKTKMVTPTEALPVGSSRRSEFPRGTPYSARP